MVQNNAEFENRTQRDHVLYSRNVVHAYSPAIQKMIDLFLDYIPYVNRKYKEGENVIWQEALGIDPTLTYACGALPASITELGRLSPLEAIEVSENYFQVPNETCAMVKSDLGLFYMERGNISNRIFYASKACEPYNQCFELLKDYGYDVHVVDVGFNPVGGNEDRKKQMRIHYGKELEKTAEWISGKKLDLDRLHEEQVYYNRIQRKIRTVLNLRVYHPMYMGSLPTVLMLLANDHFFAKPAEYEETLDALIEELAALEPGSYSDVNAILAWSGARGQEFNIYEAIDEAGGSILSWQIPNNTVHLFKTELDPLEALVDFEMREIQGGTSERACRSLMKEMKRYHAKGVVFYSYLGCSFATIDVELKRKYFNEHGIQGLSLIGSYDVGSVTGQFTTRVRAFIEMLSKM